MSKCLNILWASCALTTFVVSGCGGIAATTHANKEEQPIIDSLGQVLSPTAQSIVSENLSVDDGLNLLARVEVQPGELLEFYEPRPGTILISGAKNIPSSVPEKLIMGKDTIALWQFASKGAPVPTKLLQAVERKNQRSAHAASGQKSNVVQKARKPRPLLDVTPARESRNKLSLASPNNARLNDYCDNYYPYEWYANCNNGYLPGGACYDNISGGTGWEMYNVEVMYSSACANGGTSIIFGINTDEQTWIPNRAWTVGIGSDRWVDAQDDCWSDPFDDCIYIYTYVRNADAAVYHYRYKGREY